MTKPTDPRDIAQQFKNAPRLDPVGQPRTNSGIADQEGNQGSMQGRPSPIGGPPVAERLGGHTDYQVPSGRLPKIPPKGR